MTLGKFKRRGGPGVRPVDPQELFNSLTLRGGVENLWQPQAVALADWHKERARPDVTIEMPTGGGKTLVGLLVAQSIANEASGKVLYVCPNLQLVQQTAAKAREVGLTIATYQKKTWEHKDEFQMGNVPCVIRRIAITETGRT
jgi:replicative superfamily II helicase